MATKQKSSFKYWIYRHYPVLLFMFVWVVVTLFDYRFGKQYLDSDMASEMVLANQLNKEGVFLSKNWFYSTEIRILGNATLFRPLLLLFPNNWRLVRTIAQSFLLLLSGASYMYLTSPLKNKKLSSIFAAFSICPFGFWYMWHGTFSGFYLIWVVAYNFCAGLVFRISLVEGTKRNKTIRWILLVIVSFIIGLQSVRGLMNLQVPLLLTSLVLVVIYIYKNNIDFKSYKNISTLYKRFFISSMVSTALSIAGYGINTLFLSKIYTFTNQNTIAWKDFTLKEAITIFDDFLKLWGYPYSYNKKLTIPLFSTDGILSAFGFALMVIALIGFIYLIKNICSLKNEKQLIALSTLSIFLVPFNVFLFFKYENASYFLPGMGLMIAGLQISFDSFNFKMFKKSALAIISICVLMSSICACNLFLKYPPRSNKVQEYITSLLEEKGYTQCIGEFWSGGNVITELSNGKIEAWIIEDFRFKKVRDWLQSKEHVDSLPKGKCAVILTVEECDELQINPFGYAGIETLHIDDDYMVFGVDNVSDFFEYLD